MRALTGGRMRGREEDCCTIYVVGPSTIDTLWWRKGGEEAAEGLD